DPTECVEWRPRMGLIRPSRRGVMPNFPELPAFLMLTTPRNSFRTDLPAPYRPGMAVPGAASVNLDQRGWGSSGNGTPLSRPRRDQRALRAPRTSGAHVAPPPTPPPRA